MLVSANAFTALQSLRSQGYLGGANQYLWIDTICINQADAVEKTHQIRMMKRIYEEAQNVVAWLGETSTEDVQAIELLRKFFIVQNTSSSLQSDIERIRSTYFLDGETLRALGLPTSDDIIWEHVNNFLKKPWFSRVWVVQEYLSSTNFVFLCGDIEVEPQVIFQPIFAMTSKKYFIATSPGWGKRASTFLQVRNLWCLKMQRYSDEHLSLIDYLQACMFYEASDPRDKIFALAALSSDFNPVVTNYALPLEQVLINAAKELLTSETGHTNFLCFSRMMEHDVEVPSWVPVWSSRLITLPKAEDGSIRAPPSLSSRSTGQFEVDSTN
ncbi:hypothetical protein LTS15_007198, partial [Exophiala xenobiotica]